MDLIKAATGAVGGVLSDQWKEFIYCDEMTPETIIIKGRKRTSSQGRSSNTTAEDNIISNGSVIAVNAGQCAIIVESGKVAELCAEPGEFVYDKSTEPSVFSGSLGESIIGTFRQIGRRFTFGGDPGKDQRVYYFNMKELIGNKYGTPSLIPFPTILDLGGVQRRLMVRIKCFGEYSSASSTRFSPTRTWRATWRTSICARRSTVSSRQSSSRRSSPRLPRSARQRSATTSSPRIRWSSRMRSTMCFRRNGAICAASRSSPSV